jgi:hypothetical protein
MLGISQFSIGQGVISSPSVLSPPLLHLLMLGDSIANATATTFASDYVTEFYSYGIDATIYDAAQGGKALFHFEKGIDPNDDYYTARVTNDNAANLSTINAALIGLGNNDGGNYVSKAAWKAKHQGLIDNLKNDISSLTHIFIRPLGHYSANYNYEISWQDMREAQIELCNENPDVYLLPSYVDLELADSVHPTPASHAIMTQREAQHISYVLGKHVTPHEDPILNINNLDFYTHAHYGKTIVSGDTFSDIGALNSNKLIALNDNWTYDDTGFDGAGAMIPTTTNAALHCDDLMNMANGFMIALTVEVGGNGDLVLLGSNASPSYGSAGFFVDGGHLKAFRFDGSPNLPTLMSNVIGQRLSIIIDCQSQTEMNIYINNDTPITHDPWVNFIGWTNLFINGGRNFASTLTKFGCIWAKSEGHDSVNDPSIATIMNRMKSDYNIT